MATSPQELLQRGIAAARAGQDDAARQLLARALQMDPRNEQAWLWLSSVAQSDEERVRILQQLLTINPNNEYAIKGLQALGALPQAEPEPAPPPPPEAPPAEEEILEPEIDETMGAMEMEMELEEEVQPPPAQAALSPAPPTVSAPPPPASPVTSAPPPPAPDGIPLIESEILDYAQYAADFIIRDILGEQYDVAFDITWVPTRKRFRRRRALNPLMIAGILGGIVGLVALGYGANTLIGNLTDTGPVAFLPSPTSTTTLTPTGTATLTPQPSPTATLAPGEATHTPEATIGFNVPHADLNFGTPLPTAPYFATPHQDNPPLRDAIQKYRDGDYEAVIEEIPAAREAGPDKPDSYFFEGMAYAHLGQYDQAADVVNDGLGQGPDVAPLHAALGYIYYKQGLIEESRIQNESAKALDPALIMPYLTLAADYRDAGLYEEAHFEVESALQLDAHNVEILVAQGEVYMAQGRPDSAAAIGNLAVYVDPTIESAVLLLGRARIALGQYGQAVVPLEQYVGRVNPSSAEVWTLLGQARYLEGSRDYALDAFSKAIVLADDSEMVLLRRGGMFLETGDYEDAFADLLEEFPFEPQARLVFAKVLVETGQYTEALAELNALLAVGFPDPADQGDAYEYRGRAEYMTGLYGDARFDMEQALNIEETGTRHFYRGLALEALNDADGATLEYDWVLFWSKLYDYSFADVAAERLENLKDGGAPQGNETFEVPEPPEAEPDEGEPAETGEPTPTPVATPSS
jgi:tetratricopeptide (TPR) repeat protein